MAYMISVLRDALGEPVTTDALMEKLDCNRNTVNNYYKRCLESGNKIKKTKVGHETAYYIESDEPVFAPLTGDMVYKYLIMQNAVPGSDNRKNLLGVDINRLEDSTGEIGIFLKIPVSKYYELVKQLVDEGELKILDGRLYPGRKKIPVSLRLDEDLANEYLNILSMMPPGYHSRRLIDSIYEKLNSFFQLEERSDDVYFVVGRSYSIANRIHDILSELMAVDYINHLIVISYLGKNGRIEESIIAVGLVVYSVEKDKIYLIGERRGSGSDVRKKSNHKELTVFIDVEKIKGVKEEKGINRFYQNKHFMELYNKMFSIGNSRLFENGEEESIQVCFSRSDYIEDRLQNLCDYRKESKAKIKESEEGLIYSDMVVGLDDFLKFLRQFTGDYKIINSSRLIAKKREYIEKMLKAYSEVEE